MWQIPNLLLQKFSAHEFSATAKLSATLLKDGDKVGFVVMGWDYAYVSLEKQGEKYLLKQSICKDAEQKNTEEIVTEILLNNLKIDKKSNYKTPIDNARIYFRLELENGAICAFSYSAAGKKFMRLPQIFKAREGKWIGAKMGFFYTE
jgi:hypothetical protein